MRRPSVMSLPLGAFVLYILIRSHNPRKHYISIYYVLYGTHKVFDDPSSSGITRRPTRWTTNDASAECFKYPSTLPAPSNAEKMSAKKKW